MFAGTASGGDFSAFFFFEHVRSEGFVCIDIFCEDFFIFCLKHCIKKIYKILFNCAKELLQNHSRFSYATHFAPSHMEDGVDWRNFTQFPLACDIQYFGLTIVLSRFEHCRINHYYTISIN